MPLILILASAVAGLFIAAFIHFKKRLAAPLVCPIGHSCDPVVHSNYSLFMHIPVEILGLLYYTLTALAYALSLIYPQVHSSGLALSLAAISLIAFLFSLYLTFVQAIILREWCSWCLISAGLCTVILFSSLALIDVI